MISNLQRDTIQADLIAKQKIYENIVLAAASELREAYQNYRTAFDIAKHYYDQIIPMHEILLEEATYNYNGMIIGIFELMQSGLEKSTAEIKATDALQNLFTAELNLNSVFLGRKLGQNQEPQRLPLIKLKRALVKDNSKNGDLSENKTRIYKDVCISRHSNSWHPLLPRHSRVT